MASTKNDPPSDDDAPTTAEPEAEAEPDADPDAEVEIDTDDDDVPVVVGEDDDDSDDDEDEEGGETPKPAVAVARPAPRPQPGRPPGAKEEPPPPFDIGERVQLIQNTRPRTGTPIGNYPVGAVGRVETVLSQTAIIRFEMAPDTKEVVSFTCLKSVDHPEKEVIKAAT